MFDELDWLREDSRLHGLLAGYAAGNAADRDQWQDRVMDLDGADARELARLHGTLIAAGWVEQNTGVVPVVRPGAVPQCYRTTPAGRRALQEIRAPADDAAERRAA